MLDEVSPLADLDEEAEQGTVVAIIKNDYHLDVDPTFTLPVISDGLTEDPPTSTHSDVDPALSTPQQGELKDPLPEFSDVFFQNTRLYKYPRT